MENVQIVRYFLAENRRFEVCERDPGWMGQTEHHRKQKEHDDRHASIRAVTAQVRPPWQLSDVLFAIHAKNTSPAIIRICTPYS